MNVFLFGVTMLVSIGTLHIKHISKRVPIGRKAMTTSVQRMSVEIFGDILKGPSRAQYQIVDVREKSELDIVAIPGEDIINLPLSTANVWSHKIAEGS